MLLSRDSHGVVREPKLISIQLRNLRFPGTQNYMANPLAYFITFTCYGSHLHGAEPASVDAGTMLSALGASYLTPAGLTLPRR
jgi:hypothetical protein